MENSKVTKKKTNFLDKLRAFMFGAMTVASMASITATTAFAGGFQFDDARIADNQNTNAGDLMGKIIGILLTITRYVGVALVIYGVYEIVMSFMQNQPEAKTKGIIMALSGVIMIALKSVLKAAGVLA